MLEDSVRDYAAYCKLNITEELKSVQDVIDNMLTRLEELSSVLQIIKTKNSDCFSSVTQDINKYRPEIMTLSKKINVLNDIFTVITSNMDILEKQVEKAEADFGINNENKLKSFLKPFLWRRLESSNDNAPIATEITSVRDYFENEK